MLLLSRVCAEFHNAKGEKIFSVRPAGLLSFQEAPDTIREDPLFQMLVNDGSIEAGVTEAEKHRLENDPRSGADPSGKAIRPAAEKAEKPSKAAGPRPQPD